MSTTDLSEIMDQDEELLAGISARMELGTAALLVIDWLKSEGLDTDRLMDAALEV
jgi:hypothetical protein